MIVSAALRQRVKAVLRPAAAPLLWRLRLPFEVLLPRIELLEQRLASMPDPGLRSTVDKLCGTVANLTRTWLRLQNEVARLASSVPEAAASAVQTRLSELEVRLRAVERQLPEDIAERSYGAVASLAVRGRLPGVQPRILAPEKVEAARSSGGLRLHLGFSRISEVGYISVDLRELPGVDVVAEAGALPFDPGSVDEILCSRLVECFPQEEMRHRLLPHWRRLLKPGGYLRMVTSDGEAMLASLVGGTSTFEDFREVLFGDQNHEGGFHCNLFTPDSLGRMVKEAGFAGVEVPVRGRRNGRCFEFELVAQVPAAPSRR